MIASPTVSDSDAFAETVDLLRRAQRGDAPSLAALIERYRPRLLQRIRLMLGPEARQCAESGDFLQGVMVEILAGLPGFQPSDERTFLRWAMRIARNNIHDAVRRRREARFADFARSSAGGSVVDSGAADPLDAARDSEAVARLMDALEELPVDQQTVVELRDFDGLSFAEVGQRMQRSANAVQMLHARALIRLGALLAGKGEGG